MILLKNSIFYDVPKTGGSWVSEGLMAYNDATFVYGTSHEPPDPNDKEIYNKRFTFTFIRHPVDWYKSYYASRVQAKTEEPNNFDDFLKRMFSGRKTFGVEWTSLTDYLKPFMKCDFVGTTENLGEDLIMALKMGGEAADKGNLLNRPWVNVTEYKFQPNQEQIDLIKRKEKRLIRFYEKLA